MPDAPVPRCPWLRSSMPVTRRSSMPVPANRLFRALEIHADASATAVFARAVTGIEERRYLRASSARVMRPPSEFE